MAIDLDGGLLFHLLKGGKKSVEKALQSGIRREMLLKTQHQEAFDLIVDQAQNHDTVPSPQDIKNLFGSILAPTGVEMGFLFVHMHRRREYAEMTKMNAQIDEHLSDNDPVGAKQILKDTWEAIRLDPGQIVPATNLFDMGDSVKEEYEINESGDLGIPTPWESFNAMTRGLYPGTNTWFLARPGTGKTWILLVVALFAWLHGQENEEPVNILIISPEMPKSQLAERLFTMIAKVGYGQVVGGTLGAYGKKAYFDTIDDNAGKSGIFILDAADGITPERIELAIEQTGATVVLVDAVYKVKWKEKAKDRFENMFTGVDIISSWSKRAWSDDRRIAVVASSQLNRAADKKGGKNKSAVALSDNLSWEADNLFFLEQDEDMKADKRLRILTEKVRRMAQYVKSILVNWNMETMDFTEMKDHKHKAKFNDDGFNEENF